jgi:peptidoglycan/xylan/chitin deacetylase (PgdA/CDA1 family)
MQNHSPTSNPAARIEIPAFPGGKRIAVTTSFDDGHIYDRRIVAAFNKWGLKGTFNLNSGGWPRHGAQSAGIADHSALNPSEIAELFQGHEVAIHTVTHPRLELLDAAQIATEVLENRKALEDLVGYPVRGMAYPFGTYSQRVIEVLRALGVVYARTTENAAKCFPPQEPLAWPSTGHQYATAPTIPERFEECHSNPRFSGVFFVWGHGFEFERNNDWDGLERIYKPLSGKPDVWYCTNIQLFDYEEARQRLVIAANRRSVLNPSGIDVTIRADGELIVIPHGATVALSAVP